MQSPVVERKRPSALTRLARSIAVMALTIYVLVCLGMTLAQRQILFNVRDTNGALAAANNVAIPGSETVKIKTPDGETLSGWYVKPERSGAPVFLFFHGQGGALIWQTTRWSKIREMGAGVLAISYRGYPGSTGSPSETGFAIDARAAYDWLKSRHAARDIVIHGHSLGSGVATELARAVEARAVILEAPFTAAVDVAAERYPFLPVRLLMRDQFRSRDHAPDVKTPVLIVHGDADRIIPFHHAESLIKRFNGAKQLVRVKDGGHNSLSRQGLYDHVTQFLARHPAAR